MEARLKYFYQKFEILEEGTYVICCVTGEKIPLERLFYWNVVRQEPYKDAMASLQRELGLKENKCTG